MPPRLYIDKCFTRYARSALCKQFYRKRFEYVFIYLDFAKLDKLKFYRIFLVITFL